MLFEKIETLILTLVGCIFTAESLLNFKSNRLKSEQLLEKKNFVDVQAIILYEVVKNHLKNLNEQKILIFLTKARENYKRAVLHILKKSCLKACPHSSTSSLKYPLIAQVAKISLYSSHENVEVERGFSKSKLVLIKDKTSMCGRTLNAD